MLKRTVIILIGPKGSGKTFVGNLIQEKFGFKFVRVEDWVRNIRKGRAVDDPEYASQVFSVIEGGVKERLLQEKIIVFESTGLTDYFDLMLKNLQKEYHVITIGITANLDMCIERIRHRDQSLHINVSDDEIKLINNAVIIKNINTEYQLSNSDNTTEKLVNKLQFLNTLLRDDKTKEAKTK